MIKGFSRLCQAFWYAGPLQIDFLFPFSSFTCDLLFCHVHNAFPFLLYENCGCCTMMEFSRRDAILSRLFSFSFSTILTWYLYFLCCVVYFLLSWHSSSHGIEIFASHLLGFEVILSSCISFYRLYAYRTFFELEVAAQEELKITELHIANFVHSAVCMWELSILAHSRSSMYLRVIYSCPGQVFFAFGIGAEEGDKEVAVWCPATEACSQ